MLKCREVERKVGSDDIRGAGLVERIQVRLHLMMCRHCRAYSRQIRAIGKAARDAFAVSQDSKALARLRERITDQ